MPCDLFEDYTRMCVEKFDKMLVFWPLSICLDGEEFKTCPLHKAIKTKSPYCDRLEDCAKSVYQFGSKVEHIIENLSKNEKVWKKYWSDFNNYCLTKNYPNCQRYQTLEKDRVVSNDMNPDGTVFNFAEHFFGKQKSVVVSEGIE